MPANIEISAYDGLNKLAADLLREHNSCLENGKTEFAAEICSVRYEIVGFLQDNKVFLKTIKLNNKKNSAPLPPEAQVFIKKLEKFGFKLPQYALPANVLEKIIKVFTFIGLALGAILGTMVCPGPGTILGMACGSAFFGAGASMAARPLRKNLLQTLIEQLKKNTLLKALMSGVQRSIV